MSRDSMIFYRSFYEAIKQLDPLIKAEIYDAIFEYSLDFKDPDISGLPKTLFTLIKPQLDANNKRFENGRKGGRPPKSEPKNNQTVTKSKPNQNQEETKSKANNNNNVNNNNNCNVNLDNDISEDISKESKVNFEKNQIRENVFKVWNIYNGKKMAFEIDFEKFLEKTEGVEIDFEKLYKNAIPHNKVYFQTWLNKFFPKSQIGKDEIHFRQEFRKLGVSDKIIEDYIRHRKSKKASLSETALNGLLTEINKCELHPNEILTECIVRGWQGFKTSWLEKPQNHKNNISDGKKEQPFAGRQSEDTIAKNLQGWNFNN